MKCEVCNVRVEVVPRAAGGTVEIVAAASLDGEWMRLPNGPHVGQYIHVEGPLLTRLHAEGTRLYVEHTCNVRVGAASADPLF